MESVGHCGQCPRGNNGSFRSVLAVTFIKGSMQVSTQKKIIGGWVGGLVKGRVLEVGDGVYVCVCVSCWVGSKCVECCTSDGLWC